MRWVSIGSVAGCFVLMVGAAVVWPGLTTGQVTNRFDRIAMALEAYALDNNGAYPSPPSWAASWQRQYMQQILTTPIPYLQPPDLLDPYTLNMNTGYPYLRYINVEAEYGNDPANAHVYKELRERHGSWIVWSGPSRVWHPESTSTLNIGRYDPTNGTQSRNTTNFPMVHAFRSQRMRSETGLE